MSGQSFAVLLFLEPAKLVMPLTKTGGISHNHLNVYFLLQHINDLSLHIELDSSLSKAEGIYRQLTLAKQLPDVARKIIGLEPLGDCGGGDEQKSVQTGNVGNGLEAEQGPESLETVTFETSTGEVAFERSLNLHYL